MIEKTETEHWTPAIEIGLRLSEHVAPATLQIVCSYWTWLLIAELTNKFSLSMNNWNLKGSNLVALWFAASSIASLPGWDVRHCLQILQLSDQLYLQSVLIESQLFVPRWLARRKMWPVLSFDGQLGTGVCTQMRMSKWRCMWTDKRLLCVFTRLEGKQIEQVSSMHGLLIVDGTCGSNQTCMQKKDNLIALISGLMEHVTPSVFACNFLEVFFIIDFLNKNNKIET